MRPEMEAKLRVMVDATMLAIMSQWADEGYVPPTREQYRKTRILVENVIYAVAGILAGTLEAQEKSA